MRSVIKIGWTVTLGSYVWNRETYSCVLLYRLGNWTKHNSKSRYYSKKKNQFIVRWLWYWIRISRWQHTLFLPWYYSIFDWVKKYRNQKVLTHIMQLFSKSSFFFQCVTPAALVFPLYVVLNDCSIFALLCL